MYAKKAVAIGLSKKQVGQLSPEQEKIVAQLRMLSQRNNGKPLTPKILYNASMKAHIPKTDVIKDRFGSVAKALEKAGLKFHDLSSEGMITQIQAISKTLGRIPLHKELDDFYRQGLCFSRRQLENSSFNGYADLLKKAGLQLSGDGRSTSQQNKTKA